MERQTGRRFLIMHDPLALAVALDPTLIETRRAAVDVETAGRLTSGATVVDWEDRWGRLANTEVAIAVDAERFRRSSSTRWCGWPPDDRLPAGTAATKRAWSRTVT